jgi:hypothetical protein
VTHPITNLPPDHLRGYAHGLRNTAALLATTWAKTGMVPDDEMSIVITLTREAWEREADLVEGFAARLEGAAPASDQPRPVTRERVAAWVERFEAAARRTVAHPTSAVTICAAADAQCLPGGTVAQDGTCGRDAPAATLPTQHRWYRFPDQDDRCKSLAELLSDMPALEPYAVESSEWPGARYAFLAPNDEGTHDAILSETLEEANAYLADLPAAEPAATLTPEETAQAGLADAVAEGAATPAPEPEAQPAPERPQRSDSPWTEERLALLRRLIPTIMHMDAVHARLSALPGLTIASPEAVRVKAGKLGIYRQGLPIPEEFLNAPTSRSRKPQASRPDDNTTAEAAPVETTTAEDLLSARREAARKLFMTGMKPSNIAAQLGIPEGSINSWASTRGWRKELAALQPAEAPTPPAAPALHAHSRQENGGKLGTWTAERERVLRRDYPGTRPAEEILAEVNTLPGPPVVSLGALAAQAGKLGLRRRQPATLGPAIAPKGDAPPPMTTEDKAEARERLRTGQSKGALGIIEWFGCTEEEAQALVDEHRNRKSRAA